MIWRKGKARYTTPGREGSDILIAKIVAPAASEEELWVILRKNREGSEERSYFT